VYRDSKFVVKWDLENRRAMKGTASAAIVKLIDRLREEGRL